MPTRPRVLVSALVTAALLSAFTFTAPQVAQATPKKAKTITRTRVLKRAKSWVRKRIPYSQARYHAGYRQDCSGFVSMAWQMGTSYTTRSLPSVARRVSVSSAHVGDAVLNPGHVVIFGGWKSKRARTFYAYEEPGRGKVARKRLMTMTSSSKVLRRPGIRSAVKRVKPRKTTVARKITTIRVPVAPAPSEFGTPTVSRVTTGATATLATTN